MERGSYTAASGGLVQLRKLDIVNNNLANVNTPGFKRQLLVGEVQTFDETFAKMVEQSDPFAKPDHERTPGTVNVRTVTDFSPGPIQNTGNALDVALRHANDFFVVDSPAGPLYTRAGNFTLNPEGNLVTADGFAVQGDGGTLTASGAGVRIAPSGDVLSGKELIGRLQVVRIEDPSKLERVGASRFRLPAGVTPAPVDPDVLPQSLEMSNVSAITGVIDIITAQRGFQMYTKSAETVDQMNQTAITRVGQGR